MAGIEAVDKALSLKRSRSSSPSEKQSDIQEQNDLFEELRTPFADKLEAEIIQIFVGENDDQKTFHIHKKVLCDRIPHFAQLVKDSHNSIIKYPQTDQNTFDVLLEWVHTDHLRGIYMLGAPKGVHVSWCTESLYQPADDLGLPELMDRVMEVERRFDCSQYICYMPEDINSVYDATSENSKLRQHVAELTAYTFHNGSEKESLSTAELLSAMDNKTFARDFLEFSRSPTIKNPRKGSGCRFHMHGENERCLAKDRFGEGKVTVLSVEELRKGNFSRSKKPRLF